MPYNPQSGNSDVLSMWNIVKLVFDACSWVKNINAIIVDLRSECFSPVLKFILNYVPLDISNNWAASRDLRETNEVSLHCVSLNPIFSIAVMIYRNTFSILKNSPSPLKNLLSCILLWLCYQLVPHIILYYLVVSYADTREEHLKGTVLFLSRVIVILSTALVFESYIFSYNDITLKTNLYSCITVLESFFSKKILIFCFFPFPAFLRTEGGNIERFKPSIEDVKHFTKFG